MSVTRRVERLEAAHLSHEFIITDFWPDACQEDVVASARQKHGIGADDNCLVILICHFDCEGKP